MPTLTLEQIRGHLHALVMAAPIHQKLRSSLLLAIDGLPKEMLEEFLWTLTRPATRWSIMTSLSASIGAAQALAVVSQLPDQEMPPGLRTAKSLPMAQKARMAFKGRT